ncbi:BQ5605_C008g05011 [Microbotryum silenes-dioicae]|uniref:Mediator of RNA polymerase II transcription subunit 13 n=1 Tax=Microbotryum silenes-dioicae TaxID=796604 RepID=A0A2X0MGH8_9BASI|nr:BQ5605_C008g05011 [Microbotryum silenes-dioicae]
MAPHPLPARPIQSVAGAATPSWPSLAQPPLSTGATTHQQAARNQAGTTGFSTTLPPPPSAVQPIPRLPMPPPPYSGPASAAAQQSLGQVYSQSQSQGQSGPLPLPALDAARSSSFQGNATSPNGSNTPGSLPASPKWGTSGQHLPQSHQQHHLATPTHTPNPASSSTPSFALPRAPSMRKALTSQDVRVNSVQVDLPGQGRWKVHWRAWRGPALLDTSVAAPPTPPSTTNVSDKALASHLGMPLHEHTPTAKYDPLASTAPTPTTTLKRARSALGDDDPSTSIPVASTSSAPGLSLRARLQGLQKVDPSQDPIELALKQVQRVAANLTASASNTVSSAVPSLFSYVRISAVRPIEDFKGKGKEKATEAQDAAVGRMLWVFGLSSDSIEHDPTREALSALEFADLICVGKGHFAHRDVFPAMYEMTTSPSTSDAKTAPSQPASVALPLALPASAFPSVLSLSAQFHADLPCPASAPQPQTRICSPCEAFLAGFGSVIRQSLLAQEDGHSSSELRRPALPLGSAIVILPPASEPFGYSGRRISPEAIKTTLHLSLNLQGLLVRSAVEDVAYRPYPVLSATVTPVPTGAPVLLAPLGTPATFIRTVASSSHSLHASRVDASLRQTWLNALGGLDLALDEHEHWLVCRILIPPHGTTANMSPQVSVSSPEHLDVMWPASLCLLDGTRSQPLRSPQSTPPRPKAVDLVDSLSLDPFVRTTFETGLSSPDVLTRQQLAAALHRGLAADAVNPHKSSSSTTYHDPIRARVEQVGTLFVELQEQQEQRLRLDREAEAVRASTVAAATTAPPASPPVAEPGKLNSTAAPISMRTPISLVGGSTEALSPGDAFSAAERSLMSALGEAPFASTDPATMQASNASALTTIKNAEMDHLYPSPFEAPNALPIVSEGVGSDSVMNTVELGSSHDATFPNFDWGEDFSAGQNPGLRHNQDFDDGMMMDLNDDDFSFFDDPAPLPTSLPLGTLAGLQSAGPSPKFLDHFSHLGSGATPFPSVASPASPSLGIASPNVHTSPAVLSFSFDNSQSHNALGLGGTTPRAQLAEQSPFKTPRTPYTPYVEVVDEENEPESAHSGTHATATVSVAGTPASTALALKKLTQFEAVPFGSSHAKADDRYDPRKGKFGLPSPGWDHKELPMGKMSNALASGVPWLTAMCDPRANAARQLKQKRTPSLAKKRPGTDGTSYPCARVQTRDRKWIRFTEVDSDNPGEEDSEDDDMDGPVEPQHHGGDDLVATETGPSHRAPENFFGSGLLILRDHLNRMLSTTGAKVDIIAPVPVATKATKAAEHALETTVGLMADQTLHNPDFRNRSAALKVRSKSSGAKGESTESLNGDEMRGPDAVVPLFTASSIATRIVYNLLTRVAPNPDPLPLSTLHAPTLLLRAQQTIMQLSTSALDFWNPMGFEPLSGPKDVTAFAVFEELNTDTREAVASWLDDVSEGYQSSRLGRHELGHIAASGTFSGVENGLAALPVGALSRVRDDYKGMANHLVDAARTRKHVVIYLLDPSEASRTSASAAPSIIAALAHILKSRASTMSLVVYPLPLSTVSRWRSIASADSIAARLRRLAFAVYDTLLVSVSSLPAPVPETFPSSQIGRHPVLGPLTRLYQSPAITASPVRETSIEFALVWPPSSLEVLHRHRLLHVAYGCFCAPAEGERGPALEWIVISGIDEKGETWKSVPQIVRYPPQMQLEEARARQVWKAAKSLHDTADIEWRVVVTKLGNMSKEEIIAWDKISRDIISALRRPLHITISCAEIGPALSMLPVLHEASEHTSSPMSEEGELGAGNDAGTTMSPALGRSHAGRTRNQSKPIHLDSGTCLFVHTPNHPITFDTSASLVAPASSFLIHAPRLPTFAQAPFQPFMPASPAISVLALHVLSSACTKTSTLRIDLSQHVADIMQSFADLAALGHARWGASGRVPWHLEAVASVLDILAALT